MLRAREDGARGLRGLESDMEQGALALNAIQRGIQQASFALLLVLCNLERALKGFEGARQSTVW